MILRSSLVGDKGGAADCLWGLRSWAGLAGLAGQCRGVGPGQGALIPVSE